MNVRVIGGALLNYAYNNVVSHVPIHFIRKGLLRLFNKRIHKTAVILMHSRLLNFWKLELGERVVINQYCLLDCRLYSIMIANDTDIGPYTRIWTLGHKPDDADHGLYGANVVIGHHVWIASGVTILPGVTIGNGVVAAAASVIQKSVSEKQIVAGNPARVLRMRNNDLQYRLNFKPFMD